MREGGGEKKSHGTKKSRKRKGGKAPLTKKRPMPKSKIERGSRTRVGWGGVLNQKKKEKKGGKEKSQVQRY